MKTGQFLSFDNNELFYRHWRFQNELKTIVVMHRGHEHSERLSDFAMDDKFRDYNIFSYDQRGNGHTPTPVSPVFMDYVRDLDAFISFLGSEYGIKSQNILVVANSIAGMIVTTWVHDFAPKIAGMVLLAPAFDINLYVPMAKFFIGLGTKVNKEMEVPSYVKAKVLTHDVSQQEAYNADKLITKSINARLLLDMLKGGERILEDAAAITTPTVILTAGKDYVVKNKVIEQFYVRISSLDKQMIALDDFYHGLLFEKDNSTVYGHIHDFAVKIFNSEAEEISLLPEKFTRDEYDKLSLKMIPKIEQLNFALQKFAMGKIGSLSKGMQIGLRYGFDSGISLDYVYKNKAQGKLGFGKLMDKGYLNAIGWVGIRQRKRHLLQMLETKIESLINDKQQVRLLDIAAGTGNYLFDIKKKYPEVEIVANDFVKSNIEEGQKYLSENGISGMHFTNYDCFDGETYTKLNFKPNIVVVSGIFELFQDNDQVLRAINGVSTIVEEIGTVFYTGQPWHPQLKMIAYVLKSHKNSDWVMRRRSQKELDALFQSCGFAKTRMLIDDYGIFTVSSVSKK